ncbi:hypothetical protein [Paenibacillus sp. GP183]|uniref:hypothetical protein n=1 Tax=Paenibacillus sp. GP183 TaxID=1882751 RepID=UPI00089D517A|nr:hypothetical protein [Paenibacillus sp. GP183]SEB51005.1 hypothetical protein SAMN05443246_0776 [Paenibacillus sp. GP183]
MRKKIFAWAMIIFAVSACDARSETTSPGKTPILTDSPTTGIMQTVTPNAINTPKASPTASGTSTVQFFPATMDDEIAVRKLIAAYFDAIGKRDVDGAYAMMSTSMTTNFSKEEAEKGHFGIESIKMISIEPYHRLQEPKENADKPSVHFVVNLDVVPDKNGSWGKGSNERYVGVVKEHGVWKINALATSPKVYDASKGHDNHSGVVNDMLVTWSPNHKMVAFLKGNPNDQSGDAYIWKVNEDRPFQIINGGIQIKEFNWSPDSKFMLADSGTSPLRFGQLISTITMRTVLSFNFMGKAIFSSDSKNLAIGFQSGLKIPNSPVDPDDTFNLSVFHLDTLKLEHLLLTENARYSFLPQHWVDNNNIAYTRIDNIHGFKREEGHYKLETKQ